uniref:Uncharacterized protein n=1 Tax=Vespula pensylvanica TaxID=30213 RepID=A0A834UGP2_VESPE|nr:hypothetical protein H0235_000708 [Vespula pensylvanica]
MNHTDNIEVTRKVIVKSHAPICLNRDSNKKQMTRDRQFPVRVATSRYSKRKAGELSLLVGKAVLVLLTATIYLPFHPADTINTGQPFHF